MSAVDDLINELQLHSGAPMDGAGMNTKNTGTKTHRHQFDDSSDEDETAGRKKTDIIGANEAKQHHHNNIKKKKDDGSTRGATTRKCTEATLHPSQDGKDTNTEKKRQPASVSSCCSSSSSVSTPRAFKKVTGEETSAITTNGFSTKSNEKSSSSPTSNAHFFDDDDDHDGNSADHEMNVSGAPLTAPQAHPPGSSPISGAGSSVLFPVPFPLIPAEAKASLLLQRCPNACVVTNLGCGAAVPTLEALCQIGDGSVDLQHLCSSKGGKSAQHQMMQKKAAYYAYLPAVGNGAKNNGGDAQEEGGCVHIKCLKCSYLVVRLQGVRWEDDGGALDLYLTVRNFYPDWSRLAVASPVGHEEDGKASSQRVLSAAPNSAAYCCQCSWLTVNAPRVVIRTTMMDVIPFKDKGGNCFVSSLPAAAGEMKEDRRPPLWVCSGHVLKAVE